MPGARPGAGGARRGLGSELTGLTVCPSHGHAGGSPLPCLEGEPPSAHRGWSADTGLPRRREARGRGPGLGLRCDTAPHSPVPMVTLVGSSEAAPLPLGRGREGTPVGNGGRSQDPFTTITIIITTTSTIITILSIRQDSSRVPAQPAQTGEGEPRGLPATAQGVWSTGGRGFWGRSRGPRSSLCLWHSGICAQSNKHVALPLFRLRSPDRSPDAGFRLCFLSKRRTRVIALPPRASAPPPGRPGRGMSPASGLALRGGAAGCGLARWAEGDILLSSKPLRACDSQANLNVQSQHTEIKA